MIRGIVIISVLIAWSGLAMAATRGEQVYAEKCANCHGGNRMGLSGPALIPESLSRLRGEVLIKTISDGRAQTQMPAFSQGLSNEEIAAVADYINRPLDTVPNWTEQDIANSRTISTEYRAPEKPIFGADPLNLFVVVETGDHHISVLDGDTFERLDRFATPFAVHGGPKFSPDGRFVFVMSRDGWIQKYDLWALREVGRVRAGLNSRNIAMSKDGKWLAVANYLPHTLTILSTSDMKVEKIFEVADSKGATSRVSAVYQAPTRDSFILALKDVPEIWEIATNPKAEPVYEGFVHSHENSMKEALASSVGLFARRRIAVSQPLDDFFFDPEYRNLIGAGREGGNAVVVNLIVGREIAEIALPGMPHLGSGISWIRNGSRVMATPHLKEGVISVIDVENWKLVSKIKTEGPGFFLRSHETSPYVWADAFFGRDKNAVHVIDKQSLSIVKTLRPAPGATVAHVEFDRHGRYALVSVWEDEGALIVYDAKTLEEIKRIPMRKPSGKYNVYNKITFSEGTSH